MTERKIMVRCVNAHDRCDGGPCPYCEEVWPRRFDDGRFAPRPTEIFVDFDVEFSVVNHGTQP